MKRSLCTVLLLLSACTGGEAVPPVARDPMAEHDSTVLWPARGTVLSRADDARVLHQCSRAVPDSGSVAGFWTPSPGQVAELESLLTPLLRSELAGPGEMRKFRRDHLAEYRRQYAGLTVDGRRTIYVNGFMTLDTADWRYPTIVCDGGLNYFGVEYDPASRTFRRFSFNGWG